MDGETHSRPVVIVARLFAMDGVFGAGVERKQESHSIVRNYHKISYFDKQLVRINIRNEMRWKSLPSG